LTVSYDNLTDAPAYVTAQVELDVLARTAAISAVPEPAPLAMLLAGGLLLRLRSRLSFTRSLVYRRGGK
jgi:hypothetical protein